MLDRILATISRHALFSHGQRVGIAVSGGADSVFLLHALRELAPTLGLHLSVVHIEHGIRGQSSRDDAEFVRSLAATLELPFHFQSVDIPSIDDNLEQAGRRTRHAFYRRLIADGHVDRIATGHTRTDQAETVLYRVLRGASLAGLSGILPVLDGSIVRPLLDIGRPEIESWLRSRGFAWREDDTNRDLHYARNRLRHQILPLLREAFNPNLDETLATMATLARDEEAYWDEILVSEPRASASGIGDVQILNAANLTALPVALQRRIIRRSAALVKGNLTQIDFQHIERIREMALSREGSGRIQIPGLDIFRSFDWLRFAPAGYDNLRERDFSIPLSVPSSVELPEHSLRIYLQIAETGRGPELPGYDKVVDDLDWRHLARTSSRLSDAPILELRNWRPGDHYRRAGQSTEQKVKELFQDARIPLWERRDWPIITCNGQIVWTRRFGVADGFEAGPYSSQILQVRERIEETAPGV